MVDLYENGDKRKDFRELEKVHYDFYNFLIEKGFLIDESVDEFERVKQVSREIDNDSSNFHLIINPTMNCNFKCWYCYETHIKDSKMDENTLKATIKLAENVIKNQKGLKSFDISFFGGEPLLYFDKVVKPILIEVYSLAVNNNIAFHSSMTTNGLLINQNMLDVCTSNGFAGFQITLDGNRERHDKVRFISEGRGSYDKIVENIKLIVKNKLLANVRINCSFDTLNGLLEIVDDFNDLNEIDRKYISFDFQKVWQENDDINSDLRSAREHFRSKGFIVSSGAYNTVLQSCYGDKRYQATLNYNGEVFKCTARDFTNNSGEGFLNENGEIEWNDRYEKRLNSKFNNPPCKECKILPICGGGCSQQAIENEGLEYCIHNFDENSKNHQVIATFKSLLEHA